MFKHSLEFNRCNLLIFDWRFLTCKKRLHNRTLFQCSMQLDSFAIMKSIFTIWPYKHRTRAYDLNPVAGTTNFKVYVESFMDSIIIHLVFHKHDWSREENIFQDKIHFYYMTILPSPKGPEPLTQGPLISYKI